MTDEVFWHDGERTARVPIDCVRAVVAAARKADRVQPATAVAVFTALALHAGSNGKGARPKVDTIGELLDLSAAQVRRVINVLCAAGVCSKSALVVGGRKVGNAYTLTRPQAQTPIAPQGALPIAPQGAPQSRPQARSKEQPVEQPTEQPAAPDVRATARALVKRVWDRCDPKPATPFIGAAKIAERLLVAGHAEQAVEEAMVAAPTISTGAVELQLNRGARGGRSPGPKLDTDRDAEAGRLYL